MLILSLALVGAILSIVLIYLHRLQRAVQHVPPEAAAVSPLRFHDEEIWATAQALKDRPVDVRPFLGQPTGRRYIVVGGSGFVGGWIVLHLLARGEDPRRIRILDLRAPSRADVATAVANGVDFIQTNITDEASAEAGFSASWPEGHAALEQGLTVFHAASLIRFIERVKFLLPAVENVNVRGTQIVIDAARRAGATALIYTSSGSVGVKATRWYSWVLWASWPRNFVQFLDDNDISMPKSFTEFFSNYAISKYKAEQVVRNAHDQGGLRTVCVRPSNGIYGSGGDALVDAYMHRGKNPNWVDGIIQNCIHVENCSIAHLCAETALLAPESNSGGRAFYICDPNPPIAFSDMYRTVNLLSAGRCKFPSLHAGLVFALAHVLEGYHLLRSSLLPILPRLPGDALLLQPATFMIVTAHLIFNDSGARKSIAEGGLGYRAAYTSLQALVWTALQHEEERLRGGGKNWTFNYGLGPTNVAVPLKAESTTQLPTAGLLGINVK